MTVVYASSPARIRQNFANVKGLKNGEFVLTASQPGKQTECWRLRLGGGVSWCAGAWLHKAVPVTKEEAEEGARRDLAEKARRAEADEWARRAVAEKARHGGKVPTASAEGTVDVPPEAGCCVLL